MSKRRTSTDTSDDEGPTRFSRRSVVRATGAAALGGAIGGTALAGTAAAHEADQCCVDCVRLGKVDRTPELGDVYEFEYDGETITIRVDEVFKEDGEVTCATFKVTSDGSICGVDVKGGPDTYSRRFEPAEPDSDEVTEWDEGCYLDCDNPEYCGRISFDGCAPEHDKNPNRDHYEISNVVFYVCATEEQENSTPEKRRGPPSSDPSSNRGPPR